MIAVTRSKTRGVFNWVKAQSRWFSDQSAVNEKPGAGLAVRIFRWTGARYEAVSDVTSSLFFEKNE